MNVFTSDGGYQLLDLIMYGTQGLRYSLYKAEHIPS